METSITAYALLSFLFVGAVITLSPVTALAYQSNATYGYYSYPVNSVYGSTQNQFSYPGAYQWGNQQFGSLQEMIMYLEAMLRQLRGNQNYDDNDYDDGYEPVATAGKVTSVDEDSAKIYGKVDMNDFEDGVIFFVYGEDDDVVRDVEDEYETYADIDEEDDDLQKVKVYNNLDSSGTFYANIYNLDEDTTIYYAIGVAYENEDGDDEIILSNIKSFSTDDDTNNDDDDDDDNDSNDDEPDVTTGTVKNITNDSADIYGDVDMNDFDNGVVFFVFGEDESQIEDVEDDYDTYDDIDEDGDDLHVVKVENDHDNSGTFFADIFGLNDDTTIYYTIGVEYENEDGDDEIILGSVRSFTTD